MANLPVITGAAANDIVLGEPLANKAKRDALFAFLQALPENSMLEPAELNLADPSELVLYTCLLYTSGCPRCRRAALPLPLRDYRAGAGEG